MHQIPSKNPWPASTRIKTLLGIVGALALCPSAPAAVTAHFIEEGSNLRVTFSGTLSLDPTLVDDATTTSSVAARIYTSATFAVKGTHHQQYEAGTVSLTGAIGSTWLTDPGAISGSFGYSGSFIFWGASEVSGVFGGGISELTVNPGDNYAIFPGTSLAAVGLAGVADDTVMWTATTTGDTILFASTAAVPEPSTALLGSIAALSFLMRKKRSS